MCAVFPGPVRICVIALKTERVCGIRTSRDDASLITELAAPSDAGRGLEELVIALKVGQAPVRLPWLARGSIAAGARSTSVCGTVYVVTSFCKKRVEHMQGTNFCSTNTVGTCFVDVWCCL